MDIDMILLYLFSDFKSDSKIFLTVEQVNILKKHIIELTRIANRKKMIIIK